MSGSEPIGVLALQGAFAKHRQYLERLGRTVVEVRRPHQLDDVAALVMPGGESTTMTNLLERSGLREPLEKRLGDGMPAFGTCAGLILLASEVLDGRDDQVPLGFLDVTVRRNGYGRQVDSFEVDLPVSGLAEPLRAVFIRAPLITAAGAEVEVLAAHDDVPVLVRQGPVMAASFHPELTDDLRVHELFLDGLG